MFRTKPIGAIFVMKKERKISLHNLFVFRKLKAALISRNKVIEVIDMKPFHFYSFKKKGKIFIEVPSFIDLKIGDKVSWKEIKQKQE